MNGIYNIGRGHQYQIGEFKEWNYKNVTPYGNGPCGNVIGTTGEIFKRPTYEDRLTIFTPDLCKYSFLNYLDDTKSDGIMCRRYVLSPDTFDNGNIFKIIQKIVTRSKFTKQIHKLLKFRYFII